MPTLRKRTELPVSVEEAFAWHERPGALQRLTPPWTAMEMIDQPQGITAGTRVAFRAGVGPIRSRWVAEHVTYDAPHEFRDVQRSGPFAVWDHRHRFEELPGGRTALIDEVTYRLPLGRLTGLLVGRVVDAELTRVFAYRHRRTVADLTTHAATKELPRMKVAITGASGLIGRNLSAFLTTGGHGVVPLVRREARPGEVRWDPDAGTVDTTGLVGVDAVVHLAGEPIEPKPLTDEKRHRLRDSRVNGTRAIATALAGMDNGPRTLVSASGVNIYGDRGDEVLTEDSAPGTAGLLCEIGKAWEAALEPAKRAGIRVIALRTGIVLDRDATVLKALGLTTRMFLASPLGSGRQYWPWVSIDDTVGAYHHALVTPELDGPLNAVSPNPVTNKAFTRTLATVLNRPMLPIRVPRFAPALLLRAELADSLLFTSMRVMPQKLLATGYTFRHGDLESALRDLYGR